MDPRHPQPYGHHHPPPPHHVQQRQYYGSHINYPTFMGNPQPSPGHPHAAQGQPSQMQAQQQQQQQQQQQPHPAHDPALQHAPPPPPQTTHDLQGQANGIAPRGDVGAPDDADQDADAMDEDDNEGDSGKDGEGEGNDDHNPNVNPNDDENDDEDDSPSASARRISASGRPVIDDGRPSEDPTKLPIPSPPESPEFDNHDDCYAYLIAFAYRAGFGIVRSCTSNKRTIAGVYQYASYRYVCDMGRGRPSQSKGLRDRQSVKLGCKFYVNIKCDKALGDKWVYKINNYHNHGQSRDPSFHRCFRERTAQMPELIRSLWEADDRPAVVALREREKEKKEARDRAIERGEEPAKERKARVPRPVKLSPTEAFVQYLREGGSAVEEGFIELPGKGRMKMLMWTEPEERISVTATTADGHHSVLGDSTFMEGSTSMMGDSTIDHSMSFLARSQG